jgi:hypothetical protein
MDALAELIARDSIHQLADRYAVAVDGKDIDTIATLFVEDVVNGRYGPGRQGVRTFYDHVLRGFHCSMHPSTAAAAAERRSTSSTATRNSGSIHSRSAS